ncbi:uncharacterized protein N0V89_008915 [Didymosphaeria variabile]|uniref:Secreted protein n=1 Tax=Didymosphaeria variabile TaxID=1932322 RepID=A0A9W8XIK6_9PLEO|nr:uncharacterized protein N0V89_008915 [Didymosphaeria variabile]KAJ4350294.1 hypothetical protein N0V89_008915 [Didymosphaeria variabile]
MKPVRLLASLTLVGQVFAVNKIRGTNATAQFKNPPTQYRPKFRYWLPDASVNHSSVEDDIHRIAAVGGGGLEFLPFYNYGLGPAVTDWSIYGFGTVAFRKLFYAALNETAALHLSFDFALGANQGAGVPSAVQGPGLAKELVYGNTTIQPGATFSGKVPEPVVEFNQLTGFMNVPELWGPSELIAVVAGRALDTILLAEYFYLSVLDEKSLIDLTNVTDKGRLTWTAPQGNGTWVIFAIYERYTNQRSCVSILNATTALGNGSWMVDHWSANGAKKMTDFWDQQILSDEGIATLVREIGGYTWEDSMEMQAALPWTPDLFTRFEELHGYSITPYLPLLFHATNAWGGFLPPYNITYTLGEYVTDGGPYVQDYKSALSQGYVDYVEHYNNWASYKGIQLSNQPGYNMPIDMAEAVSHVQIPELESLGFAENIDLYRQFTGAAHLAGRNVISTEIGAVLGGAYKLRIPELKAQFDGSYAAGVNTMVIHGYAYSGEYFNTTWPGYTPFQYTYSELWNHRQPAWQHLDDLLTYSARNSMTMQSGAPKVDIAFYYFKIPFTFAEIYSGFDMNKYGYTFEYLGPENLASEKAAVVDGVLAPEGPAFKALVIYNQAQITPNASAALIKFAQNGLRIYLVGTIPNTTVGMTGQRQVSENINELLGYKSVRVIDLESFSASTIAADGILPRAQVDLASNASQLYTFWTVDTNSRSEYVYLYNQGADGVFNITFAVGGDLVPYILDSWTGNQLRLGVFQRESTNVVLGVELRSNQTKIVAFMVGSGAQQKEHVIAHSLNIKTVHLTEEGSLEALVSDNASAWMTLSNGSQVELPAGNTTWQKSTALDSWNLTVEAHGPDHASLEGNITTVNVGTLDHLAPWTQIPGIEHISGVGTYRTRFEISVDGSTAILIDFGPVLHTMKAWLNGKQVPVIDPTNPVVEVSDLVVSGSNLMEVEVTTSLFNAVKANIDHIFSMGYGPQTPSYYTDGDWQEFGLIGPIKLNTLRKVLITY